MRREPGGDPASLASGELLLQTCFHFRKFHSFLGCFGTAPFLSLSSWDFSLLQLLGYQKELSSSPESTKEASVRLLFLTRSFGMALCWPRSTEPASRERCSESQANCQQHNPKPSNAHGCLRRPPLLTGFTELPGAHRGLVAVGKATTQTRSRFLAGPCMPCSGQRQARGPLLPRAPGQQQRACRNAPSRATAAAIIAV